MDKLFNSFLLLSCGLFFFISSTFAGLPPEIEKCRAGDTECIAKKMTEVIHKFPQGNKEFGLLPLDKFVLNNLTVSESTTNGPVQLKFHINSGFMYGLENTHIKRVVGFEDDIEKSKFEVYGDIPSLTIKGDYETNGKILLLPLNGRGMCEIKLTNVKLGIKAKAVTVVKDGKRYFTLKQIKSQLQPDLMHVNLENLFNGNKELGDSMNNVINENWKDIWTELEAGINEFVENLIKDVLKDVIDAFPYDDFYKKD